MKALVVQERAGPFVMEERPDPVAGPGEAVARIIACGMGLTIQHTRMGRGQAVKFPSSLWIVSAYFTYNHYRLEPLL